MPELLLATTNTGKISEYRSLLDGAGYQIVTLAEQDISKVAVEPGKTFEQNARLKARAYVKLSQLITIADDSGLEVDALGGEPGVKSARFGGADATDADKIGLLLARLSDIPWEKRTAHFKCVIAIATPKGQLESCRGECHGLIGFEARGRNGFGYDPIFYLPEFGQTMAELPTEAKNQISHRGQAAREACKILQRLSCSVR
jgi:XTP/dITP diphosphohydrolase